MLWNDIEDILKGNTVILTKYLITKEGFLSFLLDVTGGEYEKK